MHCKINSITPVLFYGVRYEVSFFSFFFFCGEGMRYLTGMPRISEPSARNSVMWLVRLNGAVSHRPGGTLSCPPPRSASAAMALTARSNASVFTARPSPTPPKSVSSYALGRSSGAGRDGGGGGADRSLRTRRPRRRRRPIPWRSATGTPA